MAWANAGNIITTNLDSGTDSPALARADLKAALDEIVLIINGRGSANGVASLNANAKITNTELPDTFVSSASTNLTLDPATGKVKLEEILNLKPQTVAQLNARTDKELGDVAYCSNGDAGSPCLAVASEQDSVGNITWKKVVLSTEISSV